MSGSGSALGFAGGFALGALSGEPIGPPVLGIVGSVIVSDQLAIYGQVADEFWGTKPNDLSRNQ